MKEEKEDCLKCRHFYVTWEKYFLRGCRAMGFKSREIPSIIVYQASGMKCLKYEKKIIRKNNIQK